MRNSLKGSECNFKFEVIKKKSWVFIEGDVVQDDLVGHGQFIGWYLNYILGGNSEF